MTLFHLYVYCFYKNYDLECYERHLLHVSSNRQLCEWGLTLSRNPLVYLGSKTSPSSFSPLREALRVLGRGFTEDNVRFQVRSEDLRGKLEKPSKYVILKSIFFTLFHLSGGPSVD